MKSRLAWSIFCLGAILVLLGLAWISTVVLKLEKAGEEARVESMHQDNVRVALWRLDSWFSPFLVQENARPYFEYLPYYSIQQAYGNHLAPPEEGAILSPSPLLGMNSDILALHFQVDSDGVLTSPQVPLGEFRQLAATTMTDEETIAEKALLLEQLREHMDSDLLLDTLSDAEEQSAVDATWIAEIDSIPPEDVMKADEVDQNLARKQDYSQRAIASSNAYQSDQTNRQWADQGNPLLDLAQGDASQLDIVVCDGTSVITTPFEPTDTTQVSSLLPVWIDGPEPMPLLLRSVRIGDKSVIQGVLLDWKTLSGKLLSEASDLVPDARLQPVLGTTRNFDEADFLASLPVALIAPTPSVAAPTAVTTERIVLILVWIAVLAALAAAGSTIAASMAFARKRSRFASSVTHELRTPLTTFQMYSEMLADGMVQDESKRKKYLDTLKGESKRLSALVENVLTWSRVEAGRVERRTSETTIEELMAALDPLLRLRCTESGVHFSIDGSLSLTDKILVDREILERILFNLVDNACKYGSSATDPSVTVALEHIGSNLRCTVSDNGSGVARDRRRSIFRPFEQGKSGGDESNDGQGAVPGVGLGLALCRELAHVLGGDLVLLDNTGDGASFQLEIPC